MKMGPRHGIIRTVQTTQKDLARVQIRGMPHTAIELMPVGQGSRVEGSAY